ncbi:hypothetical protein ABLE68_10230 [Nocardioides sp. CN2-186]|uniref:hypothetical protein n=1 Tax=Nocardioides tweenelious TaxID=3156607 RepID=UPI0032B5652A
MAGLWLTALVVVWSGLVFFVGTPLGMIVSGVAWIGLLVVVAVLAMVSGRRWLLVTGAAVTLVLAVATYNWSAVAPRAWFELHRPLYDHAVRVTETDDSYYGVRLPLLLRPLSANGRVADQNGMLVFPQWRASRTTVGATSGHRIGRPTPTCSVSPASSLTTSATGGGCA